MKNTLLLLTMLMYFAYVNPCYAATFTLKDEVDAYNKSDYLQTIEIGLTLIKKHPSNASYHYYLANSYSRLGEIESAKKEYSICQNLSTDSHLSDYCRQALSFLADSKTNVPMNPTASAPIIPYPNPVNPILWPVPQTHSDSRDAISEIKFAPKLFNYAPYPPPPFPASALKGAEKALHHKIN